MNLWGFFDRRAETVSGLPILFPLPLTQALFVETDILATYSKILTDTMERTHGLKPEQEKLLWDSCVEDQSCEGLITMLSRAMAMQRDLFLVLDPASGVLRRATATEESTIRKDYKSKAESSVGVYVSFNRYRRTVMLRIYSYLEFTILCSLNKTINLSKAVQIKVNDLRSGVSLMDSSVAVGQAKEVAEALARGEDVMIDVKDMIETATPDIGPTEKSIAFLDAKRAFTLSLPMAYITGESAVGIGSTGEADMRAVERGLKQYFHSILHPVLYSLFHVDTKFQSQDFREITSGLEAAKTFELIGDTFLSLQTKQEIMARLFDVDPDEEKRRIAEEQAAGIANETQEPGIAAPGTAGKAGSTSETPAGAASGK